MSARQRSLHRQKPPRLLPYLPGPWAERVPTWLTLGATLLAAYSQTWVSRAESAAGLSPQIVNKLGRAVFEVVTPKIEDVGITYEKPLPWDKLPFKERNDKYQSIGTAFTISKGRFVSAAHVFAPELTAFDRQYFIRDTKGQVFPITWITRYSNHRDLIEFATQGAPVDLEPLATHNSPTVGEGVFAVGNALGEGLSVRGGQVASFTPEENKGEWRFIRFSAPASPGNSGGPLLDSDGKVIGVILRKSQSENLNFAIPIGELQVLGEKLAHFYDRDARAMGDGKTYSKPWEFLCPLPATFAQLSKAGRESLKSKLLSLTTQLYQKEKAALFPNAPELQEFLRSPTFPTLPTQIVRDSSGKWGTQKVQSRRVEVSPDQNFWFDIDKNEGMVVVKSLLQKPKGEKLRAFIHAPEQWMNGFAKSLGSHRTLGNEEIKITSYGKPRQFYRWEDRLGRSWFSALWHVRYNDAVISAHCLPAPMGVACVTTIGSSMLHAVGMDDLFRLQSDRIELSYRGKLKDWQEYLALGPGYVPKLLQTSKIKLHSGGAVEVALPGFGAVYRPEGLDADSLFLVRTALHPVLVPGSAPRLWVHGFEVNPRPEKDAWQSVRLVFAPTAQEGEDAQKAWKLVAQNQAPYDGKAALRDGNQVVLTSQRPLNRNPASDAYGYAGLDYRVLVSCGADPSSSPEAVARDCSQLEKGLKH